MKELDAYIDRVKHLPPAPHILPELLALLGEPNASSDKIVKLITYDPSLTAGVLRLSNSAHYGTASAIADLDEAIGRLGFRNVYMLVASISGARTLAGSQTGYGINQGELWKHSVTSAVAAQCLARRLGDDDGLVFTATLLHDIGKIVLSGALENVYLQLIEETNQMESSLLEMEKKILGVQHAEIGGRLLERWKFPKNLVDAVWHHHAPGDAGNHLWLAAYVYLGNVIAHFMGYGFGHQALGMRGRAEALGILEIGPEVLPECMIDTWEQLKFLQVLFNIQSPKALTGQEKRSSVHGSAVLE